MSKCKMCHPWGSSPYDATQQHIINRGLCISHCCAEKCRERDETLLGSCCCTLSIQGRESFQTFKYTQAHYVFWISRNLYLTMPCICPQMISRIQYQGSQAASDSQTVNTERGRSGDAESHPVIANHDHHDLWCAWKLSITWAAQPSEGWKERSFCSCTCGSFLVTIIFVTQHSYDVQSHYFLQACSSYTCLLCQMISHWWGRWGVQHGKILGCKYIRPPKGNSLFSSQYIYHFYEDGNIDMTFTDILQLASL